MIERKGQDAILVVCIRCRKEKVWPEGFPLGTTDYPSEHTKFFGECWECRWREHVLMEHPRAIRKGRREARRIVRDRFRRDANIEIEKEMLKRFGFPSENGENCG